MPLSIKTKLSLKRKNVVLKLSYFQGKQMAPVSLNFFIAASNFLGVIIGLINLRFIFREEATVFVTLNWLIMGLMESNLQNIIHSRLNCSWEIHKNQRLEIVIRKEVGIPLLWAMLFDMQIIWNEKYSAPACPFYLVFVLIIFQHLE